MIFQVFIQIINILYEISDRDCNIIVLPNFHTLFEKASLPTVPA